MAGGPGRDAGPREARGPDVAASCAARRDGRAGPRIGPRERRDGPPRPSRRAWTGLLLGVLAYLAWGLLSPGNEIVLREVGPLWMQAVRMGAGLLVLGAVAAWRAPDAFGAAARMLRSRGFLLALLLGQGLAFTFFVYAQTRVPAAFTTLGFYTAPVWTALLARVVLAERLGRAFWPALAVLLVGGWLALAGGFRVPALDRWGILLAVASGAAWAGYTVLLRRHAPAAGLMAVLLATFAFAALYYLLGAVVFEPMPAWSSLAARTWTWSAIQLVVPTLAALVFFNAAVQRAPASAVNLLVGLELVGTMFFAAWLLGARFSGVQVLGVGLTLAAVTGYLAWQARRAPDAPAPAGAPP